VTLVVLVVALLPLLAIRVVAAAGEAAIARAPSPKPGPVSDEVLAAAARAAAHVAGGMSVGLLTTLVWIQAGRGAVPLAVVLVVPVLLIVLDLVPRGLAAETPARWRRGLDPVLAVLAIALSPLLVLERFVAPLLGRREPAPALVTLRRFGGWLAARPRRGPLDVSEAGLVARIARFAARTARDAMVPHVDVCAVPDTTTVRDAVALVRERGVSRLPVFHERMFNAIGIVTILDLLGATDPGLPVTAVMRDPLFVPETKPLDELLDTLQHEARNLALVVDEYGGMVGLVTVEDLVEEIVGEIEDEYDPPRELYRRVAPGIFVVSARAPVTDVNERFGWNLPHGEYETLGGLVLERLGRVPKPGDGLQAGRVRIGVTRATPRAVLELRVEETSARDRRGGR
jgi:CBS domain containing-hemolysin-like protein